MSALFDIGYETGQQFVAENGQKLKDSQARNVKDIMQVFKDLGVHDMVMDAVKSAGPGTIGWEEKIDFKKEFGHLSAKDNMKLFTAFVAGSDMFVEAADQKAKWAVPNALTRELDA